MTWWQLNSEMFWIGPPVWSFGYTSQKTAKTTQKHTTRNRANRRKHKVFWKENWGLTVPSDVWISCNPVVKSLWPYKLGSVFLRLAPLTSLDMSIAQPNGSDSEARINEVSGFPLKKNLEFVVVVEWCIQKCGWPGQLGTLKNGHRQQSPIPPVDRKSPMMKKVAMRYCWLEKHRTGQIYCQRTGWLNVEMWERFKVEKKCLASCVLPW